MRAEFYFMTCVLLLTAAIAGCGEAPSEELPRPVRAVRVGDVKAITGRSFPGRAQATEQVNVSFRVSGPLIKFPVKIGDAVKKDQVLAQIDPRDFEVDLKSGPRDSAFWTKRGTALLLSLDH